MFFSGDEFVEDAADEEDANDNEAEAVLEVEPHLAPGHQPPQQDVIDWDTLFPPSTEYRRSIVKLVLPHLLNILKDPSSRGKSPRDLVNQSVDKCRNTDLWGKYGTFTRRRTVVDSVLLHYFPVVQELAANRYR